MSSYLVTGRFWAQTVERAVKTFAQAAIALLTGDGLGLLTMDWKNVASVAGLAALVSILTSIGSGPFSQAGTPDLVGAKAPKGVAPKGAAAKVPAQRNEPAADAAADTEPAAKTDKPKTPA